MGHFSVVLAADTYASVYPEGAAAAAAMVAGARARGLELTGPERSVGSVHKERAGTAGHEDMTVHLGREKNRGGADRGSSNVRNGSRPKTVLSDVAGELGIEVPRDRECPFEPRMMKKRRRRLSNVDDVVLSLSAKG